LSGGRRALIREAAGVGKQPGGKSLDALVRKRTSAADAVANAVVECTDAIAEKISGWR